MIRPFYFLLIIIIISCKKNKEDTLIKPAKPEPVVGVIEKNAMVVSAREEASRIGSLMPWLLQKWLWQFPTPMLGT